MVVNTAPRPVRPSPVLHGFAVGVAVLLAALLLALAVLFPFVYFYALAAAPVIAVLSGAMTAYGIGARDGAGWRDGGRAVALLLGATALMASFVAIVLLVPS